MKILLLGSEGMLGGELFSMLARDHRVTGKDIHDFDITSLADCRRVVEESRPDVIINAVAYTDVDGSETNREKCFAVNAEGVKNISLAIQGKNVQIVHFGTDYVFDGAKGVPYCEDDACCPINVYGQSKHDGEQFLFQLSNDFLLIRTAWLYGERGKNFVKTILEKAKTTDRLEVVTDQVGSPTFARDLAGTVTQLVERRLKGIFHITNSGCCSWFEFAEAILEYAGLTRVHVRPILSDAITRPAPRPCYSVLDGGKLRQTTGIVMRPWREALRECVRTLTGH